MKLLSIFFQGFKADQKTALHATNAIEEQPGNIDNSNSTNSEQSNLNYFNVAADSHHTVNCDSLAASLQEEKSQENHESPDLTSDSSRSPSQSPSRSPSLNDRSYKKHFTGQLPSITQSDPASSVRRKLFPGSATNSPEPSRQHFGSMSSGNSELNDFQEILVRKRQDKQVFYENLYLEKPQRTWLKKVIDFFYCKPSEDEKVLYETRIASYLNHYLDMLSDNQKQKLIKNLYLKLGDINRLLADLNPKLRQEITLEILVTIMGLNPIHEKTTNKNIINVKNYLNEIADFRCNKLCLENINFIIKQLEEQFHANMNNKEINWSDIYTNFYLEIENLYFYHCQAQTPNRQLIKQNLNLIQEVNHLELDQQQKSIQEQNPEEYQLPTIHNLQEFQNINSELTSILKLSQSETIRIGIYKDEEFIKKQNDKIIKRIKNKITPIIEQLTLEIKEYKGDDPTQKSNQVTEAIKFLLGGTPKPKYYLRPKKEYPQLTNDEKLTLCQIILEKISDLQHIKKSPITNLSQHNKKAENVSWLRKILGIFKSRKQNPKVEEISYIDWATVFGGFWDTCQEQSRSPI